MRPTALVILLMLAPTLLLAATIHVPIDQPTIQTGIDAAIAGDTVLVACGMYYEYNILMRSGITLRSESGEADCAVIDAQQQGRVISCLSLAAPSTLEGFTITGGLTSEVGVSWWGAGMSITDSEFHVINCTFTQNEALGNSADESDGGAIGISGNSSASFYGCVFEDNHATHDGGAAIIYYSSADFYDCTFSANQADYYGGALHCYHGSTVTAELCVFNANQSPTGGAICTAGSSCLFINCTISENTAPNGGGITSTYDSQVTIISSIIAFSFEGAAISGPASVFCSNIFSNAGGDWVGDIAGQAGSEGNISVDPEFCGVLGSGDDYLQSDSPCAPGNHPNGEDCGLIGALPVTCGPVSTEATSWSQVKTLY